MRFLHEIIRFVDYNLILIFFHDMNLIFCLDFYDSVIFFSLWLVPRMLHRSQHIFEPISTIQQTWQTTGKKSFRFFFFLLCGKEGVIATAAPVNSCTCWSLRLSKVCRKQFSPQLAPVRVLFGKSFRPAIAGASCWFFDSLSFFSWKISWN